MNSLHGWMLILATTFAVGCQKTPDANPAASQPKEPAPASVRAPATTPVAANPKSAAPSEIILFNGTNLAGWKETDFGAHGEVVVKDGVIHINMGGELTGFHWTNAAVLPKTNYEIELETMKRDGNDFFCGLTIPVSNSFCTLIVGGWGGSVVGISSLDGGDASENDTSRSLFFERERWYRLRLRVEPEKIQVWIDEDKIIDVGIWGRRVSMRIGEIEESKPLGIATWQTSASYRNLKLKRL